MEDRHGPEEDDEEGQHHEGVGPAQGSEDDVIHVRIAVKGLRFMWTPLAEKSTSDTLLQ